jgi:hypothetical protein
MSTSPSLTEQQLQDSVNYLLSGPGSLGQNFSGFSNYDLTWFNGNQRPPFSQLYYTVPAVGNIGENTIIVPYNNGLQVGMVVIQGSAINRGLRDYGITRGTMITNVGPQTESGAIITLDANNPVYIDTTVTFSNLTPPFVYTGPIDLSTSEMLDEYTYKFTFTTGWVNPITSPTEATRGNKPFTKGQGIIVEGVTDDTYNQTYAPIGVVECTNTYVIARLEQGITPIASSVGGTVRFRISVLPTDDNPAYLNYFHTDCNGYATVYSGTDKVFLNGQLNNRYTYYSTVTSSVTYYASINRYKLIKSSTSNDTSYRFIFDKTITLKNLSDYDLPASTTTDKPIVPADTELPIVFTNVIDTPPIGLYWYVIDLAYITAIGDLVITRADAYLRSLTVQVVKQ